MVRPKIDTKSKILSISHNDLDGVVCQIILGQVYKNIHYINASFYKIDSILKEIHFDELQEITGFDSKTLNRLLTTMEISGIIKKLSGNYFGI